MKDAPLYNFCINDACRNNNNNSDSAAAELILYFIMGMKSERIYGELRLHETTNKLQTITITLDLLLDMTFY